MTIEYTAQVSVMIREYPAEYFMAVKYTAQHSVINAEDTDLYISNFPPTWCITQGRFIMGNNAQGIQETSNQVRMRHKVILWRGAVHGPKLMRGQTKKKDKNPQMNIRIWL